MLKIDQEGRTLIEVIGVLAIIGTVAAGAYSVVGNGFDRYRLSRVGQQLIDLQKVVSQRYGADKNYANVKVSDLVSEKIAPADMRDGNALKHRFNGSVELVPALKNSRAFKITFNNVPKKACIELVTMNWINNDYTDLQSISINNSDYNWPKKSGGGDDYWLPPPDVIIVDPPQVFEPELPPIAIPDPVYNSDDQMLMNHNQRDFLIYQTASYASSTALVFADELVDQPGTAVNHLPIAMAQAMSACKTTNTIDWVFY